MNPFKKLYMSLLLLGLVLLLLTTATFAWLGLSNINTIDGLSLTATTGDFLEISFDGVNFSTSLDPELIADIIDNVRLTDVTTLDAISFYRGGLKDSDLAVTNKEYLSFPLWFRTVERERHVFLVNNVNDQVSFDTTMRGTYFVSRGVTWRSPHTFINGPEATDIVESGDQGVYYAADAVRIGFVELLDANNPLDERETTTLRSLIYDPSENPERGFGKSYGMLSYFIADTGRTNFSPPEVFPNTQYRLTEFAPFNPYQALDNTSLIAELVPNGEVNEDDRPYYVGKVQVSIWIEGWDADAFDAIVNDRLKIQLEFKSGMPHLDGSN